MSTDNETTVRRKKVKLEDVAEAAEISVSAASMALADHPRISEATKQRVREVARELGYSRPRDQAKHRLRGRTGARPCRIGLLLIGGQLQDEVHLLMLNQMTDVATANELRLELSAIQEMYDQDVILRHAQRFAEGLDGVLISGAVSVELLEMLEAMDVPHTVIGQVMEVPEQLPQKFGHIVCYDETAMGRMATTYLLEAGHKRIAFVCEFALPNLSHSRWLDGYRLAFYDAGLEPDSKYIAIPGKPHVGAEPSVQKLMALEKHPTAYIVPDVRIADSLLSVLRSRGIKLQREDIIISGMKEVAQQYRLDRYPLIIPDSSRMIRMAITHLIRLIDSREVRDEGPVRMTVPFQTLNWK